ncbi:MAG: short-chain dehydrogenase/reductase [Alphaproteobacteria bacterium]
MDLGLAGRTAVVTGASKGIGRAVAEGLAAEGVSLHLAARTAGALEAVRDAINAKHGVQVTTHAVDLATKEGVARLADAAISADILVNNAGAIPAGDLATVDDEAWRAAWDLKVFGFVNLIRRFYPAMCARKAGVIVNVIGAGGDRVRAGYIAGAGGNAALMGITRALGAVSIDQGVRVVGVNPGAVETDRLVEMARVNAQARFGDPERWRETLKGAPADRAGRPDEIADLVTYLASDRASWITGTIVTIDGGGTQR